MLHRTTMTFSHVRPGKTDFKGEGLRDFFCYRDLGVAEATAGKVLAQLVRSNNAPGKGTDWHYHGAEFHIVYMRKGWARFRYEDEETLVAAGDCVHQRPRRRALPLRLLTGHGVSRSRAAGRLHDHRGRRPLPRSGIDAVEVTTG